MRKLLLKLPRIPVILQNRFFVLFLLARVSSALAYQMLAVAVGWQIYAMTGSAFYLGLVGLVQFLPMFLLTLAVGHVADRYNRRLIASGAQFIQGLGVISLAFGTYSGWLGKETLLIIVFMIGAAHAFEGPPMQALLPSLVDAGVFPRATALAAAAFQGASIFGPMIGGFLYLAGPATVYGTIAILLLAASLLVFMIRMQQTSSRREQVTLRSIFAGIAFIRSRPVILGAISLDLFAVLLGGATALLPVYAQKILHCGPEGLGTLRAAPGIGALIVSLYLARLPLRRQVGRIMLLAVMIFGIATVIFALSTSFTLSLIVLAILGAADVFSVVIRSSLIQLRTPDEMRGRVGAVNSMFIGTSNQLGEFESGLTAHWFGAVSAVIIGGVGTMVVVLLWIKLFPELMKVNTLENVIDTG